LYSAVIGRNFRGAVTIFLWHALGDGTGSFIRQVEQRSSERHTGDVGRLDDVFMS